MIFNTRQRGRQSADPHQRLPWKQSAQCKCSLCSNLLSDPDILPTVLHPFVSPDPFRGKVLSFPWGLHGQQETGSYYVHLTGRTAAFSVRVQLSVVTASGLQVVAQSIKCRLQLAWSQQPGENSARCLKVTPAWRWEGRKWAFWTWFTPMRSNPGNHLASKLLLLN